MRYFHRVAEIEAIGQDYFMWLGENLNPSRRDIVQANRCSMNLAALKKVNGHAFTEYRVPHLVVTP